mgnify:CR=1 FL=1
MEISKIQSVVWSKLKMAINSKQISNAYIFHGPAGSGKDAIAIEFASKLLFTKKEELFSNQNIIFIAPASKDFYQNLYKSKSFDSEEYSQWKIYLSSKLYNPFTKNFLSDSNNIPVEVIKNLKDKIYFKSNKRKVVLIFNAEALSHGSGESANMLLKVLEEPPKNTTFILVANDLNKVIPTIKSRCQAVYVPRLTNQSIEKFFISNNVFSPNFISFITENNLNAIDSLNLWNEKILLDCIKDYFNAIRYKNSESILSFVNHTESLFKSSRNDFEFYLSVIKKFIKLISMINQSVTYDIDFKEFEELALIIDEKYRNMNHLQLIVYIEEFNRSLTGNANLRLSLMNMIINSNKALN